MFNTKKQKFNLHAYTTRVFDACYDVMCFMCFKVQCMTREAFYDVVLSALRKGGAVK